MKIHRSKPWIVASEQIGHLDGLGCSAKVFETVAIDPAGHHVATEQVALEVLREEFIVHAGDPGDSGATVQVFHGRGDESESIVGATKAWIATATKELCDRFAMAIGGEPETVFVFGHPERIDLALGIEFDTRAVGFEAKDIAAGEFDGVAIGTLELRDVVKAMASVDPAVETIA